jgi:hypothetical protein
VAFNRDRAGWELPWRCGLPKLVWLESGVAHTQTVAGWEQPFTVRSQSCVVHGRLVAKAVIGRIRFSLRFRSPRARHRRGAR